MPKQAAPKKKRQSPPVPAKKRVPSRPAPKKGKSAKRPAYEDDRPDGLDADLENEEQQEMPVPTVTMTAAPQQIVGDLGPQDMQIPTLTLVGGNHPLLKEGFRAGSYAYDGWELPRESEVIFLMFHKYYREVVPRDDNGRELYVARKYPSEPAAFEEGVEVKAAAVSRVLIRIPDDCPDQQEVAIFSHGDDHFFLAQWYVKATSFPPVAGVLSFDLRASLGGDLSAAYYAIDSEWRDWDEKRWVVPAIRQTRKVKPELRKLIADFTGIPIPAAAPKQIQK